MARIRVKIDGKEIEVDESKYVAAKQKQLCEFGYSSLTAEEVSESLSRVIKKQAIGVNVIDMLVAKDEPEICGGGK